MMGGGLRALVRVQGLPPGMNDADAMRETGVKFDWQLRVARTRVKQWRPDRLASATVFLSDLDVAVKGGLRPGESLDVDQKLHALERFVMRTAARAHPEGSAT